MAEQQKFFTLIPAGTKIEFIKNRWRYISISIIAILLSFGALAYNAMQTGSPLNFGIDFAGGSQVRLALDADKDPGIDAIRQKLEDLGYEGSSAVVVPEEQHEVLVRVKTTLSIPPEAEEACKEVVQTVPASDAVEATEAHLITFNHPEGGSKFFLKYDAEPNYHEVEKRINEAGCEGNADKGFGGQEGEYPVAFALVGVGSKIREQFDEAWGEGTVREIVRSETVGAKAGGQLQKDGAISMLVAISFIFLFVMIRFDLRFAPGGIIALTHDAILVIGAFAITGKEFNLQTIAALLTIIGYSINDTIVVFDRVRERVALHRDDPIEQTTTTALNETLSRTILTSGTTLLVVVATWVMGSGPIKDFAFALIVGVLVGTYSSLYIATPVFLWVNKKFYGGEGHLKWLDSTEREGTGGLLDGKAKAGDEVDGEVVSEAAGDEGEGVEDVVKKKTTRRRRRRQRPAKPSDDE
jgi:preprotein translocase subunit SecF